MKFKSAYRRGGTGIEYALIVGLIAVIAIVAVVVAGRNLGSLMSNVANKIGTGGNLSGSGGGSGGGGGGPPPLASCGAVPGDLDPAFSTLGTGGTSAYVYGITLAAGGKPVIVGEFSSYAGTARSMVARLNANGTLDTSFAPVSGVGGNFVFRSVVQSDGKIIIGGYFTSYDGVTQNRIARLNSNGTLDSGYAIGTGANAEVYGLALQSDGKLLIGGAFTTMVGVPRGGLNRRLTDGNEDTGFVVGSGITGSTQHVRDIVVLADGKILIGGQFTAYNGTTRNSIARLHSNGSLDTSFAGGGTPAVIHAVRPLSDGKIMVAGSFTHIDGVSRNRVARLNSDGTIDTGFLASGTGANNVVADLQFLQSGKFLIGGYFTSYNGTTRNNIARLNDDGSLDTTYLPSQSGFNTNIDAIAIQPADDHAIVVGNFTLANGTSVSRVARLCNQ